MQSYQPTSPYRVLSLDGGGVRCIMQLAILGELEKHTGPLNQHFDAIIGSSVGSLIGCGVSKGIPMKESTSKFYAFADEVFSKNCHWYDKFKRRLWWSYSKHNDEKVIEVMKSIYGDDRMKDLSVKPTMVVCYNPLKARPEIISSDEETYANVPVWQACKAATSAPLYFKPGRIDLEFYSETLLDGGLIANNPAFFGYVKAINTLRQTNLETDVNDVLIVSVGSGKTREETRCCIRGHLNSLTTAPFFGGSEAIHFGMRELLHDSYYRFQVDIPNELKSPDESGNLKALHAIAEDVIEENYQHVIKELANKLMRPTTERAPAIPESSQAKSSAEVTLLHKVMHGSELVPDPEPQL